MITYKPSGELVINGVDKLVSTFILINVSAQTLQMFTLK